MPRIKILPLALQNKIAAGEVVERPASVVKELLENSIDAESTRIDIDISRAGKKLIRVSDNGIGMDKEDAVIAFERHATSKIKEEADLFNIQTLGFRGEALASISAVSKMRLSTSAGKDSPNVERQTIGTCIEAVGGEIREVKACPAIGTTVEVRDLFFNTPARRKFLKSDNTEDHQIIDVVTREAIAQYKIAFALSMDGQTLMDLPKASSEKERLFQIFGKEFVVQLIETESEYGWMHVKAFISNGAQFRGNKANQFIFINNRPARDSLISHAVYKSYGDALPRDRHPIFFLFIQIDPELVDFNVHPTKKEVRFADKSAVFNFINHSLEQALKGEIHYSDGLINIPADKGDPVVISASNDDLSYTVHQEIAEHTPLYCLDYSANMPYIYLGDTLVAIVDKGGLTIIDYHAAHERINYERLLKKGDIPSYTPLFPQNIRLDPAQYRIILDNIEILNEFGLVIEDFGYGTLIVRSMPSFLDGADINSLLSDIAASLPCRYGQEELDMPAPLDSARKALAAKIACHSSIRGGNEAPDGRRIAALLKDLSAADFPNTCPHGRPTKITISMNELKKMFKK